jgi:hypothetical protein
MGQLPTPPYIGKKLLGKAGIKATTVFPHNLARSLSNWVSIDDDAIRQIWNACRKGTPDCTEDEVATFCRTKQPLIQSGKIANPIGLLIRSVPKFFDDGGSNALKDYREEQERAQERERKRLRQTAELMLQDTTLSEEERRWAEETLASTSITVPKHALDNAYCDPVGRDR